MVVGELNFFGQPKHNLFGTVIIIITVNGPQVPLKINTKQWRKIENVGQSVNGTYIYIPHYICRYHLIALTLRTDKKETSLK